MIGSFAKSHALPDGGYYGVYKPFYTKEESFVMATKEKRRVFRDKWEAEAMAWRECKWIERQRLNALRLDPSQLTEIPKFHEARSRAGKKAFAERRLREAMKENANA